MVVKKEIISSSLQQIPKGILEKMNYSKSNLYNENNEYSSESECSSEEEENAIIELDQISILASSRTSLKRSIKRKEVKKSEIYKSEEKLLSQDDDSNKLKNESEKCSFISKYKGMLMAFFSAFLTSIIVITIKKCYLYTGSEQLVIRYIIQGIIMYIISKYKKIKLLGPKKYRKLLVVRGMINNITMGCAYFSIALINPSDQSSIVQSSIIITALFGRIFLKEKLSIVHIFSLGLTVSGVLFISQPTFLFKSTKEEDKNMTIILNQLNCTNQSTECEYILEKFNLTNSSNLINSNNLYLLGILLAMLESLGRSSSQVVLRKLAVKKVHYAINNTYTVFTGMPYALILSAILITTGFSNIKHNFQYRSEELLEQTVLLSIVAVIGTFNQILFNIALNNDDVFKISVVKTADLFFIISLQTIFLNISINWLNLLGVCLIFTSTVFILLFKYFDERYLLALDLKNTKDDEEDEGDELKSEQSNNDNQATKFNFRKIIFFKF